MYSFIKLTKFFFLFLCGLGFLEIDGIWRESSNSSSVVLIAFCHVWTLTLCHLPIKAWSDHRKKNILWMFCLLANKLSERSLAQHLLSTLTGPLHLMTNILWREDNFVSEGELKLQTQSVFSNNVWRIWRLVFLCLFWPESTAWPKTELVDWKGKNEDGSFVRSFFS